METNGGPFGTLSNIIGNRNRYVVFCLETLVFFIEYLGDRKWNVWNFITFYRNKINKKLEGFARGGIIFHKDYYYYRGTDTPGDFIVLLEYHVVYY